MRIIHPLSLEEAVAIRGKEKDSSYLSGGTAVLSLAGGVEASAVVDISTLVDSSISRDGKHIAIGGGATLEAIASGPVPAFIREAARYCASLQLRSQATIGGNIALRRFDSFLIPSLYAASAVLTVVTDDGRKDIAIEEYVRDRGSISIIERVTIEEAEGESRRIGRASHSHAALIAARSGSRYCYEASGSGIAFGGMDSWKDIEFKDDLTGSAEYKRYIASVIFEEAR